MSVPLFPITVDDGSNEAATKPSSFFQLKQRFTPHVMKERVHRCAKKWGRKLNQCKYVA
jgi:hypothetical protein